MLIGLFVTCIVLTLSPHRDQAKKGAPAHAGAPARGEPRQSAAGMPGGEAVRIPRGSGGRVPPYDSQELYSLRARRRFAAYLRMRLLEMREAGLERAADAVERRLPADALVP